MTIGLSGVMGHDSSWTQRRAGGLPHRPVGSARSVWVLDVDDGHDPVTRANEREVATLCRHFPALEGVMLLVWAHIQRTDLDSCAGCESAPSEATA